MNTRSQTALCTLCCCVCNPLHLRAKPWWHLDTFSEAETKSLSCWATVSALVSRLVNLSTLLFPERVTLTLWFCAAGTGELLLIMLGVFQTRVSCGPYSWENAVYIISLSFAEANRDVGAEVQQPKWRRRLVAAGLVGHHDGSMPAGSAHGRTMKRY